MNINIRNNFSFKRKSKSNCKNEIHDMHLACKWRLFNNVHCHFTVQSLEEKKKKLQRVENNGGRTKLIKKEEEEENMK